MIHFLHRDDPPLCGKRLQRSDQGEHARIHGKVDEEGYAILDGGLLDPEAPEDRSENASQAETQERPEVPPRVPRIENERTANTEKEEQWTLSFISSPFRAVHRLVGANPG